MPPELLAVILSYIDKNDILKIIKLLDRNNEFNDQYGNTFVKYHKMLTTDYSDTDIFGKDLKHFKNLSKVNFNNCSFISNKGLKHLENIQNIDLSNCTQITDRGLRQLKGIHTINLNGCEQITDKGLKYLMGVHTIYLNGCKKISDDGLGYLKGVNTISINECTQITDRGLMYLSSDNLHTVSINGCKKITEHGLKCMSSIRILSWIMKNGINGYSVMQCLHYFNYIETLVISDIISLFSVLSIINPHWTRKLISSELTSNYNRQYIFGPK
jgi:hypothetical protein